MDHILFAHFLPKLWTIDAFFALIDHVVAHFICEIIIDAARLKDKKSQLQNVVNVARGTSVANLF